MLNLDKRQCKQATEHTSNLAMWYQIYGAAQALANEERKAVARRMILEAWAALEELGFLRPE